MKIIGIESSGLTASVSLLEDETLVAEFTIQNKQTHSQTLLPMIDEMFQMAGVAPEEVDGIAISAGPGSFTGLRIGAATAKGLGLALQKPLIEVSSLEAMAYNLYGTSSLICPIMDARRSQTYTAIYRQLPVWETVREPEAMAIEDLLKDLLQREESVIFIGDGIPVFRDRIEEQLAGKCKFAPAHLSRQRAASVALVGYQMAQKGKWVSAGEMKPVYLRLSQAERERLEGHL